VPEEVFWQSFYAADCMVEKLKCAKENRESIAEFGSGYGTFTFLLAKRGASRCSSGCTNGNNFPSAPSSPLLHSPSSWVTACRVDGGVIIEGSRRRELYHDRGIFTAQPEAIEKKLRSRGGSYAAVPLTHMNRHTQQTSRRKTKNRNQTLKNRQP
jgi:hypothetical protein